ALKRARRSASRKPSTITAPSRCRATTIFSGSSSAWMCSMSIATKATRRARVGKDEEMSEHSETEANREVIRKIFEAWEDGTCAITDVFAPDMVWRIEGHSVVSREYATTQEFVDDVLAPFGARFAAGERFRPVRVRSIVGDDDTVVVVWDGHGVANDGQPY